jgi:hypothetical protein
MNLVKKHAQFLWTPAADEAFASIKQTMVQALVLALPDFTKEFDSRRTRARLAWVLF